MTLRHRLLAAGLVLGLVGCGAEVPTPGTLVDVTGSVSAAGKPLAGVTVNFQPTGGTAQQAALKAGADGTFSGKLMAGKYSWYLAVPEVGKAGDAQKATAALKSVPAGYKEASMDRQIDVAAGQKLDLEVK